MTTHRSASCLCRSGALIAVIAVMAACGGSDEVASGDAAVDSSQSESTPESEIDDNTQAEDVATTTETESETESDASAPVLGRGSATLSLDNGESYEFSALCVLEPQMAAGSEILFTATSYDDPGFDVTQFGDVGPAAGIAAITVFNGSYESLWEAGSMFESVGGSIDVSLNGSTITGTGSFFPAGDMAGEPVGGTLTANC